MIRRAAAAAVVFVVSYGAFLVASTPAAWLIGRLHTELAVAHVSLGEVRGTAWTGSGQITVHGIALGRIRWQTRPWTLVKGQLSARLHLVGQQIHVSGQLDAGRNGTLLRNVTGESELAVVARIAGLPSAIEGGLSADFKSVQFAKTGALEAADGRIVAHRARLARLGVALGTVTLGLQSAHGEITGRLSNRGGDLDLAGHLSLSPTGYYTLQATLKPHPGQNRLRDGLSALLGRPDAEARYHFDSRGIFGR